MLRRLSCVYNLLFQFHILDIFLRYIPIVKVPFALHACLQDYTGHYKFYKVLRQNTVFTYPV
jgi:hypothetical protein